MPVHQLRPVESAHEGYLNGRFDVQLTSETARLGQVIVHTPGEEVALVGGGEVELGPALLARDGPQAQVLRLLAGLWLFGAGEACLVAAGLGNSPWTVLSDGVAVRTPLSIGVATVLIGVVAVVSGVVVLAGVVAITLARAQRPAAAAPVRSGAAGEA